MTIWRTASTSANGIRVHTPVRPAIAPASQGSAEPPTRAAAFMTPMAVGTSRAFVSWGVIAIAVGKTGPRKKPSITRATLASAAVGDTHASVTAMEMPARQAYNMRAVLAPIRPATGLITNRPSARPSQYPLTGYAANDAGIPRAWTR
jgi:hypothetical protein